ncbi:transcriptional activator protein Pur-beta [Anopheles aquasalis]|nr:transcriptional activator protein Pur-beta [Anopheles aquasalis]
MIRALLPVLAYVSLLLVSSSYSLHMARDAYIKPPPPPPPPSSADAQLLDDLDSMSELLAAEENSVDLMRPSSVGVSIGGGGGGGAGTGGSTNVRTMLGSVHQKLAHSGGGGGGGVNSILSNSAVSSSISSSSSSSRGGSISISNSGNSNGLLPVASITMGGSHQLRPVNSHVTSNELPELSPPPAHLPVAVLRHGPIGPLVVGPQPPRALQELFGVQTNFDIRAAQQHRQHDHQQYADGGTGASSSSSSSSMDDRDDDDGGGGGGVGGGGSEEDTDTDREIQRTATANSKRASPTNSRNKMMADSGGGGGAPEGGSSMPSIPHSVANQMMLRSTRGQRQYDVPQIECPPAMDGMERFACPTPDRQGRYRCIDDHVLCDGFIDCPEGEDEDRQACMFYKTTKAHLDVLADALLRWARGR